MRVGGFFLIICSLFLLSCKEKRELKEIIINKDITGILQKDNAISKDGSVYVVSLFTDNGQSLCEIVKCKESPVSLNFIGCQILENDTIFLYTDKRNKYFNCYNVSGKIIKLDKKQFTFEHKKEIKYYKLDTLNCSIAPLLK